MKQKQNDHQNGPYQSIWARLQSQQVKKDEEEWFLPPNQSPKQTPMKQVSTARCQSENKQRTRAFEQTMRSQNWKMRIQADDELPLFQRRIQTQSLMDQAIAKAHQSVKVRSESQYIKKVSNEYREAEVTISNFCKKKHWDGFVDSFNEKLLKKMGKFQEIKQPYTFSLMDRTLSQGVNSQQKDNLNRLTLSNFCKKKDWQCLESSFKDQLSKKLQPDKKPKMTFAMMNYLRNQSNSALARPPQKKRETDCNYCSLTEQRFKGSKTPQQAAVYYLTNLQQKGLVNNMQLNTIKQQVERFQNSSTEIKGLPARNPYQTALDYIQNLQEKGKNGKKSIVNDLELNAIKQHFERLQNSVTEEKAKLHKKNPFFAFNKISLNAEAQLNEIKIQIEKKKVIEASQRKRKQAAIEQQKS